MGAIVSNDLFVEVFSTGTTPINDPLDELPLIEDIRFSTGYPGGLYLDATMRVARDVTAHWFVKGAQRIVIRNGKTIVFEGKIGDLNRALQADSEGIAISAIGYWGALLSSRRLRRLYADQRTHEEVWVLQTGAAEDMAQHTQIVRSDQAGGKNELRIEGGEGLTWLNNQDVRLRYTAPKGEEIRRIDYDYDFEEDSLNFSLLVRDVSNATDLFEATTSAGATGQNDEPASGCSIIDFSLVSKAASQTPTAGAQDVLYAELTNVTVYATMNHAPATLDIVNLTEIAKDIRAEFTELSADEFEIDSNTLSLVPFVEDVYSPISQLLIRAASYGDTSQNSWAVGIRASDFSTDDLPLLFVEQYPDLTDYDFTVRIEEAFLDAPFDISEGYIGSDENNIWNWIIVEYSSDGSLTEYVTPDDDVLLKDTNSIADFGQRDYLLRAGHSLTSVALHLGRRFLAAHKDPVWNMTNPISVKGSIRAKAGNLVPVSEIQAGKRIRIENFLRDPAMGTDDLIFLITETLYEDEPEVCTITTGLPNSLDVILAQQEFDFAVR